MVTTYQKFSKSAQNLWESHGEVLDEYAKIYNKNRTPSKKRKMSINHRWEFLSTSCEDFHNLYPESQIESLLDFLLNCSSKIPEIPVRCVPNVLKSNMTVAQRNGRFKYFQWITNNDGRLNASIRYTLSVFGTSNFGISEHLLHFRDHLNRFNSSSKTH